MQRNGGPSHVALGESEALGDAQQNGHDTAAMDPLPGQVVDAAPAPNVPAQLAALAIRTIAITTPLDEVVRRLKTRADLQGIPAIDEEIAAEAKRRLQELGRQDLDSANLLHGSEDSDYPTESDIPCDRCGGVVILRSAAEDRAIASRVAAGVEIEVLCDGCAASDVPAYADAPDEVIAALGQDDPAGDGPIEPKAEDQADAPPIADAFTRLVARELPLLDLGAACTAEMSLHMITVRVRDAVLATDWGKLATDAEIVAEAERIWVSLDRKRSHTYSVEQDGTIRDWRRPDTTPDRGDVTAVHTITDDEPRFSGAGAADGQAQQQGLFLVPADKDFNGKLYREAPELANLAESLIERYGFLEHLEHCEVRYFWKRKTGVQKGQRITGGLKRGTDLLGQLLGADFAIWLAADTARERQFNDRRVERHLFRQLRRVGQDDKGNWIELPFTLQVFTEEIVQYADVGDEDLKIGHGAFRNADQMGLFADDDEDTEVAKDDGAGVLIHDDGTPLTDDEIEAMERHELNDDPADGDYDPLADHDL